MGRKTAATRAEPARLAGFEERLSFLVHRLHANLTQVASRLLRAHDLDPVSARILVLLLERTEMRVGELVEVLVLPQSTVSHQLRRLERAGLIGRNRPAEDSRSVVVTLTRHGLDIAAECDDLSRLVHERMVEDLAPAEIAVLRSLLLRVFGALDDMRTTPAERDERPKPPL